ncbi:acylphosphatase [Calidifontibacillus erzurumensis]|uniref:acylphosphatase n=1 Tax=Calidifontibacillus erzurumensis TaxID=2741433 RepID=UPI0035B538AF
MERKSGEYLPHLTSEMVADARGVMLDAYAIALEGWRRGLQLKWYAKDHEEFPAMKTWYVDNPGKLFSLSNGEKTHYFFRTRGDKVTNEAVEICSNKEETKHWLTKSGITVPNGQRFTADATDEEIIQYVSMLDFPVVLKPTDGSFGRGVVPKIENMADFKKALVNVRSELNYKDVIVERHIPGKEYRLYVVGNQVVGAINRIPANVTGDGVHTIKQLIDRKNEDRSANPRLISCPIVKNQEMIDFVLASGYKFDDIPKKGETVYLTAKSNISIGGDPIDVLDTLSEIIKETAVKALNAIPGLPHGAVDLIFDETKEEGVVLEINPTAQIGSLLFPLVGQARDVPAAIIDYYFPETKGIKTDREKIFFNINDLLEPLVYKKAVVTTVSPAPVGTIYTKKFIVSGSVQNPGYHRGLRKQAFDRKLSGFISKLDEESIEIIVAGTDKEMIDEFKQSILEDPERSTVTAIQEEAWNQPVKVGFEVKADMKEHVENLKQLIEQKEKLKKELKSAKKKNKKIKESFSWKITKPIRVISKSVKKLKSGN